MNIFELFETKKKSLRNTNPCWKGYHPVGTKEKNGKTVPNCVPEDAQMFGSVGSDAGAGRAATWGSEQNASPIGSGMNEEGKDLIRKIVKQSGKPVGEIGIDPEASPGGGEWYVKHYASGYNVVGFDNAEEALAELKYCLKQSVSEDDAWHSATSDEWHSDAEGILGGLQEGRLSVGDPVIVTAPNAYEGKTGEIAEFSPSGKFVIVRLYNGGEHSMHLSDVEYNQYADDEDADEYGEYEHDDFNAIEEDGSPQQQAAIAIAKKKEQGVEEGQWNYPKSMTTIPKFDKEADDYLGTHKGAKFARKNKEDRKEWRKAQKAQAHKELMTGKQGVAEGDLEEMDRRGFLKAAGVGLASAATGGLLYSVAKKGAEDDKKFRHYVTDPKDIKHYEELQSNYNMYMGLASTNKAYYIMSTQAAAELDNFVKDMQKKYKFSLQTVKERGVAEGSQNFNKREPYYVCLAGKPIKKFDYYADARRFHDNWYRKLCNQGEQEKADKITLMPIMGEDTASLGIGGSYGTGGGSGAAATTSPENNTSPIGSGADDVKEATKKLSGADRFRKTIGDIENKYKPSEEHYNRLKSDPEYREREFQKWQKKVHGNQYTTEDITESYLLQMKRAGYDIL